MTLAPIVIFTYNRPLHTEETLNALMQNDLADQSTLFIYSDAPKYYATAKERQAVEQTKKVVKSKKWCKEVTIIERKENYGLQKSIISGVHEILQDHDKVIVLEDDIVTSKGFLKYMNEALDLYENCEQVMQVNGYVYPYNIKSTKRTSEETFFLSIMSCWGWGTWKRAWKNYNHDIDDHYNFISSSKEILKKFDIDGNADFFDQLSKNREGTLSTWAVRWYASWFRLGGYALFPSNSLVKNIGNGGSGIHSTINQTFDCTTLEYISVNKIPVEENKEVRKAIGFFFGNEVTQKYLFNNIHRKFSDRCHELGFFKGSLDFLTWAVIKIFSPRFPALRAVLTRDVGWTEIISSKLNCAIEDGVTVDSPYHLAYSSLGKGTYIVKNSYITYTTIGKFCSIGANCICGWGIHPTHGLSTSPLFYSSIKQNGYSKIGKVVERQAIKIGNDVFIGLNVTILDGVTIGDGAVIGAGAVVSKDIPPYAIAVGNPIKVIKYRFSQEIIDELLKIKWWDWDDEKLAKIEENFFDVERFVEQYKKSSS